MLNFRSSTDIQSPSYAVRRDISNLEEMAMSHSSETVVRRTPSQQEKPFYSDSLFINAAQIFQSIHVEKSPDKILVKYGKGHGPLLPHFKDERTQRWSYKLAFNALKYQDLLENMLLDSGIYPFESLSDDSTSLLAVMVYDFQDRKFQPRLVPDTEEVIPEVREIENYIYSYKTKLAAALARCRIKYDALTIDYILPETVRSQERRAFTIPLYAWVNTAKISVNDICYALKMEGFTKVNSVVDLEGYSFCVDENCKDVLAFPPNLKDELVNMKLFTTYKLILQDKSQSLAVHSVSALMNLDDDIIVTNMYSGLTVAHMSTLTNQYTCNIFVCGIKSASKEAELQDFFTHMECKNVKLFQENFTDIHPTDPRFHKAKVILLQPQCSGSGVCDPVEFILNEHGDTDLLQDFSQGSVAEEKLNALSNRQLLEMVHAMKFNKVQAIVYYTCSVYKEENEDVVKKALEFRVDENKHHAYRLSPPVVPLCYSSEMISASNKFFKVEPSDISNGCFLAVLTRERDPSEAVSVKDVLARAAAKGLLEGVELTKHSKRDERKKKYKTSGQKVASSTTVSQAKITEFINKESLIANAKVSPSKTISEIPRNAANQVNNSSQLKKSLKHTSNSGTTEHGIAKTKNSLSTVSKMFEKQTSTGKPKSEDKLIVLKPVEILLPPVMLPYFSAPGNKARNPPHPYYYRWSGLKTSSHGSLVSSLSIIGRSKETFPFSVVRHPRPWL
ncbi:putative methyltransferase NSUN7 [Pleurodeles waltl]|uniref:putative methyltransferase NSUN7 n=1 Tax=Pleurodeles waltl TaxID=8319 RepID=UPI003709C47D